VIFETSASATKPDQAVSIAFIKYMDEFEGILLEVFHERDSRGDLREWLRESASTVPEIVDLLHDPPVKSVARFVGLDLTSVEYGKIARICNARSQASST
jgi:hypothetical protein